MNTMGSERTLHHLSYVGPAFSNECLIVCGNSSENGQFRQYNRYIISQLIGLAYRDFIVDIVTI